MRPLFIHSFRSAARAFISALVLIALMWAQVEMQRHLLQHDGAQFQRRHEQGLQNPVSDAPCLECSLLAGGVHAVAGSEPALAVGTAGFVAVAERFISRSVAVTRHYSSRAPPPFL